MRALTIVALLAVNLPVFSALAGEEDPGLKIWKAQKCDTCHGAGGKADTKIGQAKKISDMTTADWQKKVTDEAARTAITKGIDRTVDGKQEKMKAYDKLKAEEIDALIKLMRSWAPKT